MPKVDCVRVSNKKCLGRFDVTSGQLKISEAGSVTDEKNAFLQSVLNGKWHAMQLQFDGLPLHFLWAHHKDHAEASTWDRAGTVSADRETFNIFDDCEGGHGVTIDNGVGAGTFEVFVARIDGIVVAAMIGSTDHEQAI